MEVGVGVLNGGEGGDSIFIGYTVPLPFRFELANAFHHDNFSLNMH